MFNLYGSERLAEWKKFRTELEVCSSPLDEVANFWSKAPFVSPYIDPYDSKSWPDPWHLVLDDRYDDLAICLGMLYTIKLTQRFMDSDCEIHMSMSEKKNENSFFLVINKEKVLNYSYNTVSDYDSAQCNKTNIIWSGRSLP